MVGFGRVRIVDRDQVVVFAVPGRFEGDADAVVEVRVGVVDFEVGDAGLDDLSLERVGVQVQGLADPGFVAWVEILRYGRWEGATTFNGQVEEFVELARVGDVDRFGVQVGVVLLGKAVEESI